MSWFNESFSWGFLAGFIAASLVADYQIWRHKRRLTKVPSPCPCGQNLLKDCPRCGV